ncbi:hypothetical protein CLV99_1182 [Sphingobacterium yanglingense]|uniref:Lauroyl/myristoyl acyltransferase n=2 Tax=Sphingobacterium yanglingense TaxID=1437280 RepID=A0A4R6WHV4_9SPHI|nr:hypothetical protein CLV99_1182 [Sphingobacterium yanglingense]
MSSCRAYIGIGNLQLRGLTRIVESLRNDKKVNDMDTVQDYTKELQRLHDRLYKEGIDWNQTIVNRLTDMSANMAFFFPELDYRAHRKIFRDSLWQLKMDTWDLKLFAGTYPYKIRGWKGFLQKIRAQTGMICTYHFGAYQLINYLLLRAREPFALLVGDKVYNEWEQRNTGLEKLLGRARRKGRFTLINATDRASLRKMYELSARGHHLLVYVDGLEGIKYGKRHLLEQVEFLGCEIEVPRGAISVAHALKLPIYPMLAVRGENTISIESMPTIAPVAHSNRTLFARSVLYRLYGWFGSYLVHWPEQWTNWPFLQKIRPDAQYRCGEWYTLEKEPYDDPMQYGIYYRSDGICDLYRKRDLVKFSIAQEKIDTLRLTGYGGSP